MRYCIVFFVPLLTFVWADIAIGEWDYLSAEETRPLQTGSYKSTNGKVIEYVIAVGTESKPVVVQAERIEDALSTGKEIEIRLKWVKIEGRLFAGTKLTNADCSPRIINQDVYFVRTTFSDEVGFENVEFSSNACFEKSTFSSVSYVQPNGESLLKSENRTLFLGRSGGRVLKVAFRRNSTPG